MNLIIIGTSHIAKQSINEIKAVFKAFQPDIIAVELDMLRFKALMTKQKSKFSLYSAMKVGFVGFLFALIGAWASKKLGKIVGVEPGEEMLTAIKLAKKNKKQLALIDQDINITLARLSKFLTFREKMRVVGDIFRGIIFRKREMKKWGFKTLDLTKVPEKELIKKLIKHTKTRYPNFYKVLIHERNIVMARRLKTLIKNHSEKKIMAVMGAGHKDKVIKIIKTGEA